MISPVSFAGCKCSVFEIETNYWIVRISREQNVWIIGGRKNEVMWIWMFSCRWSVYENWGEIANSSPWGIAPLTTGVCSKCSSARFFFVYLKLLFKEHYDDLDNCWPSGLPMVLPSEWLDPPFCCFLSIRCQFVFCHQFCCFALATFIFNWFIPALNFVDLEALRPGFYPSNLVKKKEITKLFHDFCTASIRFIQFTHVEPSLVLKPRLFRVTLHSWSLHWCWSHHN